MFAQFKASPNAPKGQTPVGGGFVWNVDSIISYTANLKEKPDPDKCSSFGMNDYVAAIRAALAG